MPAGSNVSAAWQAANDEAVPTGNITEAHWNILQERERLYAAGLSKPLPIEEAFRQIRETFRKEHPGM